MSHPLLNLQKFQCALDFLNKNYLDALYLVDLAFSVSFLPPPRAGYTY